MSRHSPEYLQSGFQKSRAKTRVFLENLPKDIQKDEIMKEFSTFGRIAKVYLIYDPPGSGFVEYFYPTDAMTAAEQMDSVDFLGSVIQTRLTEGGMSRGRGYIRTRSYSNMLASSSYDDYPSSRGRGFYGSSLSRGSYDSSKEYGSSSRGGYGSLRGRFRSRGDYGESRSSYGDSDGGYRRSRGSYGESRGFRGSYGEGRTFFRGSRGGMRGSRDYDDSSRRGSRGRFDDYRSGGMRDHFDSSKSSYNKSGDSYEGYSSKGYSERGYPRSGRVSSSGRKFYGGEGFESIPARYVEDEYEMAMSQEADFEHNGTSSKYSKYQSYSKSSEVPDASLSGHSSHSKYDKESYHHRSRSPAREKTHSSHRSSEKQYSRSRSPTSRDTRESRTYEQRKKPAPSSDEDFDRPRTKSSTGYDTTQRRTESTSAVSRKEYSSSSSRRSPY